MTTYKRLVHVESGRILIEQARWCNTFAGKLRGFTFHRTLTPDDGLVLVEKVDTRANTAIHMLFVFIPLGVIWVNEAGEIVDSVVAKPWRPSYVPSAPARYVIEGHPSILKYAKVGDHIRFEAMQAT